MVQSYSSPDCTSVVTYRFSRGRGRGGGVVRWALPHISWGTGAGVGTLIYKLDRYVPQPGMVFD